MKPDQTADSFPIEMPPMSSQPLWLIVVLSILAAGSIFLGGLGGALVVLLGLMALPLLRRPFMALNLVLALSAFDAINTLLPSSVYTVTATKVAGYLLGVALLIDLASRQVVPRMDFSVYLLTTLLAFATASAWSADSLTLFTNDLLRLGQLAVLFIAVRQLVTTLERLRTVALTIVISLTVGAVIAIVEGIEAGDRISGVSQNAAILATDLFIAAGLAVGFYLTASSKRFRLMSGISLILLVIVLGMTETRAAFLAVIPAGAMALFVARGYSKIMSLLGVAVLASFVLFGNVADRMEQAAAASDTSTVGHLRTLYAGAHMLMERPVLGVGLGNFRLHYLRITNDPMGLPKTAHNSYLSFAAEMGVPGLVLWPLFVLVCALALIRAGLQAGRLHLRELNLWYGLLVFALVGSATMATFHTLHFSKYLWLLLGLATNARLILNDVLEQQADREDGPSASSERDASGEES